MRPRFEPVFPGWPLRVPRRSLALLKHRIAVAGLAVGLLVALMIGLRAAQPAEATQGQVLALGDYLTAEGALDLPAGTRASFDATDYQLVSGPNDAPRFAPAGESWSPVGEGVLGGLGSGLDALAVASNGNVYAGGSFSWAGDDCSTYDGCQGIAMWDGTRWHPLGSGIGGSVRTLALDASGNLYAGGLIQRAGECTAAEGCQNIAMWDGTSWHPLGSGIGEEFSGEVLALALDSSGKLYAGGEFQRAGECIAEDGCQGIAMWDGTSWHPLGSGMDGAAVNALAIDASDTLYAGGRFENAGACTSAMGCEGIAMWDGAAWSPLGGGMDGYVSALALDGSGNLYASGNFDSAGACTDNDGCQNIARWDGAAWYPLGEGAERFVGTLAVDGTGNLYTTGAGTTGAECTDGFECHPVIMWNGSSWSSLGWLTGRHSSNASALAVDAGGDLYAGGTFTGAGECTTSDGCNNLARWDGTAWHPLGSGMHGIGAVYAIALAEQGNLYIGGTFNRAGSCTTADGCKNIAMWDGTAWRAVGSGAVEGEYGGGVSVLALDGSGNLYAGGAFEGMGDCTAAEGCNFIARWDGTTWHPLGSGMDLSVGALALDGSGNLYAGGGFERAGDCTAAEGCHNIARWDGTAWHPLGSGTEETVSELVLDGSGNLYAGGAFVRAGDCTAAEGCQRIARWDGTTWHPLGSGIGDSNVGHVSSLVLDGQGNLYAGGMFSRAGECSTADGCVNIARWDGTSWHPLGSGLPWSSDFPTGASHGAFTLALDGRDNLYAGGMFNRAGDCSTAEGCRDLARWDGTAWCSLGSGTEGTVFELVSDGMDTLYAGGTFTRAGTCTATDGCNSVAKWTYTGTCQSLPQTISVFLPLLQRGQ